LTNGGVVVLAEARAGAIYQAYWKGHRLSRKSLLFLLLRFLQYIVNGLADRFRFFLMSAVSRTGNDAEPRVLRPVGQIHSKAVPRVIDPAALRLRKAGKGAARRTFPAPEGNHGDIVVPGEVLLWGEQTFTLEALTKAKRIVTAHAGEPRDTRLDQRPV
jgi:hypothetical protein